MSSKSVLTFGIASLAIILAGCTSTAPEEAKTTPTTVTTPTAKATATPKATAIATPSITPYATPGDNDNDEDTSTSVTPTPSIEFKENQIEVSYVEASLSADGTLVKVHVEGKFPDTCTLPNYSWQTNGNVIEISLGKKDDTATECKDSGKSYSKDLEITAKYLKNDQEYTISVNGVASNPITFAD